LGKVPSPTSEHVRVGTYRYHSGSLYLLAMLHLSGKFSLFY
jgi:hypothetical protein